MNIKATPKNIAVAALIAALTAIGVDIPTLVQNNSAPEPQEELNDSIPYVELLVVYKLENSNPPWIDRLSYGPLKMETRHRPTLEEVQAIPLPEPVPDGYKAEDFKVLGVHNFRDQ